MTSGGVKKLASNTGALFALQLANYILPFIIIPFLTRKLGVSLYGVVAFGLAMVQIACITTDFGFNLSATRQIASNPTDREFIKRVVGAVNLCKFLLILPVVLLLFVFLHFQEQRYGEHTVFFWFLLIPIVGHTFQPIWLFQGIERMGFITLFVVLARSTYVLLALLWISGPDDYTWVAIANGTAQAFAAILATVFMIRLGYAPIWPGWTFTRRIFSDSLEFFWSRAALATYTAGGAFYLGLVSTPTTVAYYSAAEQLYKGIQSLLQPVSQALFPYMTRTKDTKLFVRVLKISIALSLLALGVGTLSGEWLLATIFGPEFAASYPLLVIFLLCFCITTPSVLLGYPFLAALGDARSANLSVILGGVVQLSLLASTYAVEWRTAIAVGSSILLAEAAVLGYRCYKGKKLSRNITTIQRSGNSSH